MKPEMIALFLHVDLDDPDEEIIKELQCCAGEAYFEPKHGGYWCHQNGITIINPDNSVKERYTWPEFIKVLRGAGQLTLF